jgi:hypothetical protein
MSRLEQRLTKLEDGVRQDDTPISLELVFVSTDGTPSARFRLTDDGLVAVTDDCADPAVTDGPISEPDSCTNRRASHRA